MGFEQAILWLRHHCLCHFFTRVCHARKGFQKDLTFSATRNDCLTNKGGMWLSGGGCIYILHPTPSNISATSSLYGSNVTHLLLTRSKYGDVRFGLGFWLREGKAWCTWAQGKDRCGIKMSIKFNRGVQFYFLIMFVLCFVFRTPKISLTVLSQTNICET